MSDAPVRIDKWLWAARFFKTRSLATDAVEGGKVQVNGARVKPAKDVKPGDELEIHTVAAQFTVRVLATAEKRGSAAVAQTLYAETEASLAARAAARESARLAPEPAAQIHGRPTKRDRRQLQRFRG